ncbi:hypothetical protein SGUI_0140 [Serinicoccus hydrothermalis]|uniref:Uncharacterized protein n=1 Tax=Serinicoccus hydrothermalis TaxID=1758689 RepID=A0A1B1N7X6_9MICO|nr:hypothetical protein [Serinicoccus hydrothermalis]ANS77536.1 hypothetical protein SGUI_0140 [Serinicoccus hydrothermalis]
MTPEPPTDPARSGGLLLSAGPRAEVDAWVGASVVPVTVVPLEGWTAVVTRGGSQAGPPYEDGGLVSACRVLSAKAGPGLGFYEVDGRALVTAHPAGRRRRVRWVVWEPEQGLLRPPGLDLAGPAELVRLAGADPGTRDELVELLHETGVRPARMLQAVMATLGLPGTRLVEEPARADDLPGAVRVVPDRRQVGWFEDAVRDSVRLRQELGVLS